METMMLITLYKRLLANNFNDHVKKLTIGIFQETFSRFCEYRKMYDGFPVL